MIRVYCDWNVVSNLKREDWTKIRAFFTANKETLLCPYSPAHFQDLMKSYTPNNSYFEQDLNTLEEICGKHLLLWDKDAVKPYFETPKDYFEKEKNAETYDDFWDLDKLIAFLDEGSNGYGTPKLGQLYKSMLQAMPSGFVDSEHIEEIRKFFPNYTPGASMWDMVKDTLPFAKQLTQNREFYLNYRKQLGEQGLKLDVNSGNWNEDEVINNIDTFLKQYSPDLTFMDYVNKSFENRKDPVTRFEFFNSAYVMLDMIGYKKDKLPKKTDSMQNIQTDAQHAFYGAYCDFFVVGDKNLMSKAKVLYNLIGIKTKVITPDKFIDTLDEVIHKYPTDITNVLREGLSFVCKDTVLYAEPVSEEDPTLQYAIKLPKYYLNLFNYATYTNYEEELGVTMTFDRLFFNYSTFAFYTEVEAIIDKSIEVFGEDVIGNIDEIRGKFIRGEEAEMRWLFNGALISLCKFEERVLPTLTYVISTKQK